MALKGSPGLYAPDGSMFVSMTDGKGNLGGSLGTAGTPFNISATNGAGASITLTVPNVAGQTIYVTSWHLSIGGATAAAQTNVTWSGLLGSNNYEIIPVPAGILTTQTQGEYFTYPWAATGVNIQVQMVLAAFTGTGSVGSSMRITGYYL